MKTKFWKVWANSSFHFINVLLFFCFYFYSFHLMLLCFWMFCCCTLQSHPWNSPSGFFLCCIIAIFFVIPSTHRDVVSLFVFSFTMKLMFFFPLMETKETHTQRHSLMKRRDGATTMLYCCTICLLEREIVLNQPTCLCNTPRYIFTC